MSSVAGNAVMPGHGELTGTAPDSAARPGRQRLRRVLQLVIATLLMMVALEVAFYLFLVPRLRLTTVSVTTDLAVSDAEVLEMAGLTGAEQFFSVDAAAIDARLEQHPLVREATVALRFPNTLNIALTSRQAVAVVLTTEAGGAVRAALVDSEGMVFLAGVAQSGSEYAADVPVLGGLAAGAVLLGQQLPEPVHRVLADLHTLRVTDPVLSALVSEVRLVPVGGLAGAAPALDAEALATGFDTVLFPIGFETPLRFGERVTAHHLAEAFVLLDLMRARTAEQALPAIAELDLRSGAPVAVPAGSRSGGPHRGAAHGE